MALSTVAGSILFLFAPIVAWGQAAAPALQPGEALLEVQATGEAKAVPDVAEFSTGVTTDGASAQTALAANARVAERLVSAAMGAGVAETDIRTRDLSVRPRYRLDKDGDETEEIIGYRASNRLVIKTRDLAAAPRVVDALIGAGATGLDGPSFEFSDDAPLLSRARADAVVEAQQQARDYAAALHLKLGRVLRVSERAARTDGPNDIVVTGSRVRAPIKPGEQSVTVTVWIDYALTP